MKKIIIVFAFLMVLPFVSYADTKKTAVYFYASWCPHCQNVNKYFVEQGFYEKYDIQKLDFDDKNNQKLLSKIFEDQKNSGGAGIPAIVVDDKLLVGDKSIIDGFQKEIDASQGTTKDYINSVKNKYGLAETSSKSSIPIIVLLGAAFADAANPCALAVLILLLATVISAKGRKRALLSGFMFSLAIFIYYLLMGLGVYKAISVFGVSKYLSLGVGVLAVLIALANFKDVFWYGKFFVMEVPRKWRPKMQAIIRKATSPWSAFGIGFVVSLFLVPCASGPYVVILGMLAEKAQLAKTFTLLVLYNFVFVLPMLIVTLAMYFFHAKMGKLEKWRKENLQLLHAVTGMIMLLLGVYLIVSRI